MKRTHVAIFNEPLPTVINPTRSFVAVLVRRGVRVTHITSRRYAKDFAELGTDVLISPWIRINKVEGDGQLEETYATDLYDANARMIELASDHFNDDKPDLILYSGFAFAGCIVAAKLGVKAIRMTPQLVWDEDGFDYLNVSRDSRGIVDDVRTRIRLFMNHYGVPHDDVVWGRANPTLYFYVKDLQIGRIPTAEGSLYAGRCAAERPLLSGLSISPDERTTILITASTTYLRSRSYYVDSVRALATPSRRIIISDGPGNGLPNDDELPEGCSVARGIPQLTLLPRIDLLVCQPGMSTAMEALYHGCRLLMLSVAVTELEWYADNAQLHGLGKHLRGADVTPAELNDAATSVLADRRTEACVRRMQRAVRESEGGEGVANWIEQNAVG